VNDASLEVEPVAGATRGESGGFRPADPLRLRRGGAPSSPCRAGRPSVRREGPAPDGDHRGAPCPRRGGHATVSSDRFASDARPGERVKLKGAQFDGAVTARRAAGRKAWAGGPSNDEAPGLVTLTVDAAHVTRATAFRAEGQEDCELLPPASRGRPAGEACATRWAAGSHGPGGHAGREEPAVLTCRDFDYDPAARTARYRGNALLRSGRDEVRAAHDRPRGEGGVAPPGREAGHHLASSTAPAEGESRKSRPRRGAQPRHGLRGGRGRIVLHRRSRDRQGDILTRSRRRSSP